MDDNPIAQLRASGWTERFTASGERLREAIENYRGLGLAVKTIPVGELDLPGCTECFTDEHDPTMLIFTKPATSPELDDLYKNGHHSHQAGT
jgi:hypothetical protein